MSTKKIISVQRVIQHLPGHRVALATGCFDMLHIGHVRMLQATRAKYFAHIVVVGLMSDAQIRYYKGTGRPLIPEDVRAEMIAALECVDYVTIYQERQPCRLMSALKPEIWVKGGDYTLETLPEAPTVLEYGGKIEIMPYHDGWSTTGQLHKIRKVGGKVLA